MTSRTKNARAAAPVRFSTNTGGEFGLSQINDGQDEGEENVMDMMMIMQELQKKKNAKASSRSAAFQGKKNALIAGARKEAETMAREGSAYIEQCKARVEEMRSQVATSEEILKDATQLWSAHAESFENLLAIYPELIEDLSPQRAQDINTASEMLETHPLAREASRRRMMKNARKNMEAGMENQKLATDASALIKHYKALLLI